MTQAARTAWPADGARLLELSISCPLGAVLAVTPKLRQTMTAWWWQVLSSGFPQGAGAL